MGEGSVLRRVDAGEFDDAPWLGERSNWVNPPKDEFRTEAPWTRVYALVVHRSSRGGLCRVMTMCLVLYVFPYKVVVKLAEKKHKFMYKWLFTIFFMLFLLSHILWNISHRSDRDKLCTNDCLQFCYVIFIISHIVKYLTQVGPWVWLGVLVVFIQISLCFFFMFPFKALKHFYV